MSKVKPNNYIMIPGWMITDLNLKGNELLVYAIIYGFSQDGESQYTGSIQYLADWCNSSKESIRKCLNNLVDKGLLHKESNIINNVKFCTYTTTIKEPTIQQSCIPTQQSWSGVSNKVGGGIQQSCTNNTNNNTNINNTNNIYNQIQQRFNLVCSRLSTVTKITDKRKKSINARVSEYGLETIFEVFDIVSQSNFLNGDNNKGWKADFDWIMKPNNFIKILEGNYQNNNSTQQSYRLNSHVNYNTPRRQR